MNNHDSNTDNNTFKFTHRDSRLNVSHDGLQMIMDEVRDENGLATAVNTGLVAVMTYAQANGLTANQFKKAYADAIEYVLERLDEILYEAIAS